MDKEIDGCIEIGDEKITISEKDLYCIGKLLQSSLYGQSQFDGCQFCRYQCHKIRENEVIVSPNYDKVIYRLQDITGVDFGLYNKKVSERLKNDKRRCGDSDF